LLISDLWLYSNFDKRKFHGTRINIKTSFFAVVESWLNRDYPPPPGGKLIQAKPLPAIPREERGTLVENFNDDYNDNYNDNYKDNYNDYNDNNENYKDIKRRGLLYNSIVPFDVPQ